jgi:type II secretory pathway pseudopilin PulG
MSPKAASGYSLTELAVAVGVIATVAAIAVPAVDAGLDEARTAGAARYLSARLVDARMEAIQRSTDVAVRFASTGRGYGYTFAVYADGNHNGVLARDVQDNVDRSIRGEERLSSNFRNVDFGTLPGLPAIDAGGAPPGDDPVRCGTSNSLSFGPLGTSSSGTVYVLGRSRSQYAVRVFGGSAKIRVYRFDWRSGRWSPQ